MDLLMRELHQKKQTLAADFAGKKLLRRSEINDKKIQQIRSKEIDQLHSKSLLPNPNPNPSPLPSSSHPNPNPNPNPNPKPPLPPDEQRIDDLALPRQEVVRHLRVLAHPATLFGEDDASRLERLKTILKSGALDADADIAEGQTNDFLRDICEMRKRQRTGGPFAGGRKGKRGGSDGGEGGGAEDGGEGGGGGSGAEEGGEGEGETKGGDFDGLCDEEKILVFFRRLLNEWNRELDEMGEAEKRTAKGKSMVATFNQCARYLNPLFKFCRKKVVILFF